MNAEVADARAYTLLNKKLQKSVKKTAKICKKTKNMKKVHSLPRDSRAMCRTAFKRNDKYYKNVSCIIHNKPKCYSSLNSVYSVPVKYVQMCSVLLTIKSTDYARLMWITLHLNLCLNSGKIEFKS